VPKRRQIFNETFKEETVKFVQEQTKSLPQIAEELNIPAGTLRQWMGKYRKLENEPLAMGLQSGNNRNSSNSKNM
jgi:transposase